jgi:hypothetical protein
MARLDRRGFFGATAGLAAGGGLFQALVARQALATGGGRLRSRSSNLRMAGDELALPPGFHYSVISREGEIMADGFPTPKAMDGMAAFALPNGNTLLIRNHEDREDVRHVRPRPSGSLSSSDGYLSAMRTTYFGPRAFEYDPYGLGGTTSVEVDRHNRLVRQWWSLVGTTVNCAGGPTPWGSWITCEETIASGSPSATSGFGQNHGYCFEVPVATAPGAPAVPVPLKHLGRMSHEAVAVDPATGTVFETEDAGDTSGFYRFVPDVVPTAPGQLATTAGVLQMLKIVGVHNAQLGGAQTPGVPLPCEWVPIATPDSTSPSPYSQGVAAGGAIFRRLEGCWYASGKVFFQSTNGGKFGYGQVWVYDIAANTVTLLVESASIEAFDGPDNICVSPNGGLVVCEDSGGATFLRGITPTGDVFDLARNLASAEEFAGACFSPDGRTLFVNIFGRSTVRNTLPVGVTVRFPVGHPEPLPAPPSSYASTYVPEYFERAMTLAIRGPFHRLGL